MAKNPALRAVSGGSAKAANRGEPFPGGKSARFTPLTIRSASDEAHKVLEAYGAGSKRRRIRAKIHGSRERHFPDRPRRPYCAGSAQSACYRPRARRARRSEVAVSRQPDINH